MSLFSKLRIEHYKLLICIVVACVLWPMATWFDLNPKGWHVFAVFISVIISFILRPYPMGMSVLIGLLVLVGTNTISLKESLSGFSDTTVWLVIAALLIAGAVIKTGFGIRLALWLVSKMGKSIKGLAYAICTSEFLLGSVIPSNTARGGGIHAPIVDSLARSIENSTEEETGAGKYLSLVGSHANLIAASMFMTGMAANPLVSAAAKDIFDVEFGWGTWLLGSIIPGIISLLLLPLFIFWMSPTNIRDGRAARNNAKSQLDARGKITKQEVIMMSVLIGMVILWASGFIHQLPTTLVAWIGVAALLILGTQTWKDILENTKAWDTLFWLGGLLTMASMLVNYGFIQWFVDQAKGWVYNIPGLPLIIILGLIYFYSMYAFSMLSGHIAAIVAPFFLVSLAAGAEPMITIAIFAYFSCLCGCTTNYSSGPVIIYFALGYNSTRQWFSIGFLMSLVHIIVWLGAGMVWWKILGWY